MRKIKINIKLMKIKWKMIVKYNQYNNSKMLSIKKIKSCKKLIKKIQLNFHNINNILINKFHLFQILKWHFSQIYNLIQISSKIVL